ncbi:MAG: lipase family alpha/beta hydrolase [Rubripirellula sp.]
MVQSPVLCVRQASWMPLILGFVVLALQPLGVALGAEPPTTDDATTSEPGTFDGRVPSIDVIERADAERAAEKFELLVPAIDGQVQWSDVATSLGNTLKLDSGPIREILPPGKLDLRSDAVLLTLMAINLAARDQVSFDLVRGPDQQLSLKVTCNRSLFAEAKAKADAKPAVIEIDDDWLLRSENRPLVICIHGLQGDPEMFDPMRRMIRSHGYATATIDYDDQQSIATSAIQASELMAKLFEREDCKVEVALVGHSMGGLVAREWTENPTLQSDPIVALITAGTPHQGSAWATLPPMMDLFTAQQFSVDDLMDVIFHTPSSRGLRDLAPGSSFLRELSSRPHRRDVALTAVAGTGSPISAARMDEIQQLFRQLELRDGFVRLIRPRIEPLIEGFDELARGRGDGVVSVESATMDDCENVVTVDLSHFELVRPVPGSETHPVWEAVIARLKQLP